MRYEPMTPDDFSRMDGLRYFAGAVKAVQGKGPHRTEHGPCTCYQRGECAACSLALWDESQRRPDTEATRSVDAIMR